MWRQNLGNIAATVSLNIDPFQQSARVLETQTRAINRALEASEVAWKNNSKNINAQKTQYELTGKAIQVHTAQLDKQKQKHEALKAEIGNVNNATAQQKTDLLASEAAMNKTGAEIERLTAKYESLGREIAISESNWTKSGKALEQFGNQTVKIGKGLSDFGKKMTLGVTAPIVAGVGLVTKAAMDWESSFAGVKKTNDEVVDANGRVIYSYQDLEGGLRELAKTLPSTHGEIAAVAEAAGQLGIKTQDVVGFTKTMIDLGESTNLSAETAATSIARIANITGMTSDEYQKFGSSLVALGNNFATTESEILEMSNRLASAGTIAGLTETDILGLATAMSSVGIQAEAGGTAMTQTLTAVESAVTNGIGAFDELEAMANAAGYTLTDVAVAVQDGGKKLNSFAGELGTTGKNLKKMYDEADKSAVSLQNFADVTGMTAAEFADTWEKRPVEAIQAFIKGLNQLDENGGSVTEMLDTMEMSGVRQGNMLKSLALASDVLTEAVDMSGKAWGENTALTEEANKRYETTESQLKMLKNEAMDMAIEMGGPFLQAIRDVLQALKPFVERAAELAKAFSEANPETQQAIIKFGLLAAAIGPASSVLGGFLKVAGGGISVIGKVAQGIGVLTSGATAAVGVSGATGLAGLATGLGALVLPAAAAVGALGLVAGAVIIGKKAYEDHQLAGNKWGIAVTKEQDKVIEKSLELRDEAVKNVNAFSDGVTDSAEKVIEANQAIVDAIQSTIDKEYERAQKNAERVENENIQNQLKEQAERDRRINEQIVRSVQDRVDAINKIMGDASQNSRNLSDAERQFIQDNYKQISAKQLEIAGFTKSEIIAIEAAYQSDLSKMTTEQLQERSLVVRKSLDEERASYEEQRQAIIDGTENNTRLQKQLLAELDEEHKASTETRILGYAKLLEAQGVTLEEASGLWEQWGWTVDEVNKLVASSTSESTKNLEMFAKGTSDADMQWNAMALDPKTGEVRTNMAEMLLEMASTQEGWEQLIFLAKNADLSTNAIEEIAIAIGEQGNWDNLSFAEKSVLVNNDDAMMKLYESINELGMWNQYESDRKLMGADNADFMYKTLEAMGALNVYNGLSTDLKTLIADGPAKLTINEAEKALEDFNNLPPDLKKMLGDNSNVNAQITAARETISAYNRNVQPEEKVIKASTNAWTAAESAKSAIDSVYGKTVYIDVVKRDYGRVTIGNNSVMYATGTPYHMGGPAILGDAGKAEPFLTPSGVFGISPPTDTQYNLERGTKVWPSISKMLETLPHYKNGTQFDDTVLSRFQFNRNADNQKNEQQPVTTNTFYVDQIIWKGKDDIRKTMEELGWAARIEERGSLA